MPANNCVARWQPVLAGAEKVLGAAIDQEAHSELVDKLAAEL